VRKTLAETAKLIRSKNAGPFWLTFDVMFDDADVYRSVRDQDVLNVDRVASLFGQDPAVVRVFAHDSALAVKVSFPRPSSSGSALDTDVFGGQQYAPLMDLTVELGSPSHAHTEVTR
jgi:Domain of unknown function (DUF4387)